MKKKNHGLYRLIDFENFNLCCHCYKILNDKIVRINNLKQITHYQMQRNIFDVLVYCEKKMFRFREVKV